MNEVKRDALKPEEELVDVLLDFIIVSATLAKKVTLAVREKQIKESADDAVCSRCFGDLRCPLRH